MIMNLFPVLKEILNALQQLVKGNKSHFIYTNKMPFSKEDIQILAEVFTPAQVEIQDRSTNNTNVVRNTRFPGVWVSTLWGRSTELTPILEILEINWYPSTMGFPMEDLKQGLQEFEDALYSTNQIKNSVKQKVKKALAIARGTEKEVRLPLTAEFEVLPHYILVPGPIYLESPHMSIHATQFWGVWISTSLNGERELIFSPFPEAFRAQPQEVHLGIMQLQQTYRELLLAHPVQGMSS